MRWCDTYGIYWLYQTFENLPLTECQVWFSCNTQDFVAHIECRRYDPLRSILSVTERVEFWNGIMLTEKYNKSCHNIQLRPPYQQRQPCIALEKHLLTRRGKGTAYEGNFIPIERQNRQAHAAVISKKQWASTYMQLTTYHTQTTDWWPAANAQHCLKIRIMNSKTHHIVGRYPAYLRSKHVDICLELTRRAYLPM